MSIENPDRGTFLPFSRRGLNAPDPSLSISAPPTALLSRFTDAATGKNAGGIHAA